MPINTKLILISGEFPFGHTETFLETEIEYLAKLFNDILILPSRTTSYIRDLPPGVRIDSSYAIPFQDQKLKISSIFSSLFLTGILKHFKYLYSLNALRRVNSYVADALVTIDWLQCNLSGKENTIIYTYWFNGKTYGAMLYGKNRKHIKVISRGHRYDIYDYWFQPPFWPFRQNALDLIEKLYLISSNGINYMRGFYNAGSKCTLSKLGTVDPGFLTVRSTDGTLRIVSVSGVRLTKRVDHIANSLIAHCRSNNTYQVHWSHIGDGPEKVTVLKLLDENSPFNLVYNFMGHLKNCDVLQFYQDNPVDLFINMSSSEGIPVSIMEAISCGIPCIATDVGGNNEIVNDITGFLLPNEIDFKLVSSILLELANNTKYFDRNNIKQFWEDNYNAINNYDNFCSSLMQIFPTDDMR